MGQSRGIVTVGIMAVVLIVKVLVPISQENEKLNHNMSAEIVMTLDVFVVVLAQIAADVVIVLWSN